MSKLWMAMLSFGAVLCLGAPAQGWAQGMPSCDGLTQTTDGIKASLSAKKETATSGLTEITFSLKLKDTKGGHGLETPKVKTTIGKPATVKAGDEGQPGSVEVTFSPKSLGLPSSVSAKFIDASGKNKTLDLKCVL